MCIGAAAGFMLVPDAWRMRKSAVASLVMFMPGMSCMADWPAAITGSARAKTNSRMRVVTIRAQRLTLPLIGTVFARRLRHNARSVGRQARRIGAERVASRHQVNGENGRPVMCGGHRVRAVKALNRADDLRFGLQEK